jgi:replicative DNA helicase
MKPTMKRRWPRRKEKVSPARLPTPRIIHGRVPPHDLDAEGAVLSAILLWAEALGLVRVILQPFHFYSDANGRIYEAMLALADAQTPVDSTTVASYLRDRERLAQVGGAYYLGQLADLTPAVAHVEAHARVVRRKWRLRAMIATCQRIAAEGYGDVGDEDKWIDAAEVAVQEIAQDRADDHTATLREALRDVFQELTAPTQVTGLKVGLRDVDTLVGPLRAGNVVVIGAASGAGKTGFGMQMAVANANALGPGEFPCGCGAQPGDWCQKYSDEDRLEEGAAYHYDRGKRLCTSLCFSAEMTRHELALRSLFSDAGVDNRLASRPEYLSPPEWTKLEGAAERIAPLPIYIDDRSRLTIQKIRSKARRIAAQARRAGVPLGMVLVDYIQLLAADEDQPQERREREIAVMSAGLKDLAKELGVVVVVLAQINKDPIKEKRSPRASDLRECGAIAMDADKIILLHNPKAAERARVRVRPPRDGVYAKPAPAPAELVDAIVDKARMGGRTGTAVVVFFPSRVYFGDATEDQIDEREREEAA